MNKEEVRKLFDFVKDVCKKIDGYWIESAGHPIIVKGVFIRPLKSNNDALYYCEDNRKFDPITPVVVYGFYDYPKTKACYHFGEDDNDELEVQFNAETLCSKLGKLPEIATLLNIENSDWIVTNRSWVHNRFVGAYRLELTCQRHQESVTTGVNKEEKTI